LTLLVGFEILSTNNTLPQEKIMTIQVGEHLPEGKLTECTEFDPTNGYPMNPQPVDVGAMAKGKRS